MPAGGGDPGSDRALRERALGLLARREHAPAELAAKLSARGYDDNAVAALIAALQDEGLLSARRYAEAFVHARAQKGQGPVKITAELAARRLDEADIDDALAAAEVDWTALATQARRKRFGSTPPADFPAKAKQMRFLQQRGFTSDQIHSAVDSAGYC